MPFFCISSNLAKNSEEIHQSGLLWEKIRASTSIPGVIPPMLLEGELHLDGGLLNNLPVDIMRNFVGQKGKVIAIELNNFSPDTSKYNFPPILTLKDALFSKLKIRKNNYKFPLFMDAFLQELFLSSLSKEKKNAMAANMFVSLDLTQFRMLHTNQEDGAKLVQIGYEETMKLIELNKK